MEILYAIIAALIGVWLAYKFFCICYKSFKVGLDPEEGHLSRSDKRTRDESRSLERRKKIITVVCPNITMKLSKDGFSSLNSVEKEVLFQLTEQLAINSCNLHENEIKALEVACSDQATYNIIEMRNIQLSRMNQASALASLKSIKSASIVSAMNAAKEMGESLRD